MEPQVNTLPTTPTDKPSGEDRGTRCRRIGEIFAAAAQMRDNGVEPQQAEEELTWRASSEVPELTIERIRETVELVYFDREYNQDRGESLVVRVSNRCTSGRGPFAQPLP
jgi:hypothetical protein